MISSWYYCKKKGHVMSECRALEKKNQRVDPELLITRKAMDSSAEKIKKQDKLTAAEGSLSPFVFKGIVYLEGSEKKVPIDVLRDTGATESLILDSVLPFSDKSSAGVSVLLQGVEMGVLINVTGLLVCIKQSCS